MRTVLHTRALWETARYQGWNHKLQHDETTLKFSILAGWRSQGLVERTSRAVQQLEQIAIAQHLVMILIIRLLLVDVVNLIFLITIFLITIFLITILLRGTFVFRIVQIAFVVG